MPESWVQIAPRGEGAIFFEIFMLTKYIYAKQRYEHGVNSNF